MRCVGYLESDSQIGKLVSIPDDEAVWIISGEYGDGSFDVIREGGTTWRDIMVGWHFGESYASYAQKLDNDAELVFAPQLKQVSVAAKPLLVSDTTPKKRGKK